MFETKQRDYDRWILDLEKEKSETLKDLVSVKEEQARSEEKIEQAMSDEDRWKLEYGEFTKSPNSYKFKQILETIYKFDGEVEDALYHRHADVGALAMADTRGLISYSENTRNRILFTQKGKFFAKLYLEKHSL